MERQMQPSRFPILDLVNPREQTLALGVMLIIGLVLAAVQMIWLGWPLWAATVMVLCLLLIPAVLKWRTDARRYGVVVMVLSVLLAAQGFHTLEHLAQWVEYHILNWPASQSAGFVSPANSEWIHFVWNWTVVLVMVYLIAKGFRNPFVWLLLTWSVAHSIEHTYLMVRYLQMLRELQALGVKSVSAQGLPGILGADGWLARSAFTQNTLFCNLPGLTTAPRLDVHFWWNAGEMTLLLLAAHTFLRRLFSARGSQTLR